MTWLKIIAALALATVLVAACQKRDTGLIDQGRTEQRAVDQKAQDKIKADAAFELAAQTALTNAAEDRTLALKQELEVARETAQTANRAAVAARAAGQRLRFVAQEAPADRCGGGGGGAQAAPDLAASDPGPAYVELPAEVNRRLWELAGEAESLAIDYRTIYAWANNPEMVCTLQSQP